MTKLSPAAQTALEVAWAVIEAYMDENCGDEMMPSEIAALAAAFRAAALYLSNDCQELTSIANKLEAHAQGVLDAFRTSHTGQGCLAAALRAVAEQGETFYWDNCPVQAVTVGSLLAIASELEAHMIVVQLPSKP